MLVPAFGVAALMGGFLVIAEAQPPPLPPIPQAEVKRKMDETRQQRLETCKTLPDEMTRTMCDRVNRKL